MSRDVASLSEREKQTLRLLLGGYDAKSSARHLGLSVHTVNERLRDARRKLDVTNSREAARLLADAEGAAPNALGDKQLGVPLDAAAMANPLPSDHRRGGGWALAWLGGGMLIMSLIVAALVLTSILPGDAPKPVAAAPAVAPASGSVQAARGWADLLDQGRWDNSWRAAAALFKSSITAAEWAATIQAVRTPLGAVSSRTLQSATPADRLPGAPAGSYEIVQFRTDFAQRRDAIETVVMMREGTTWKVSGYFIK
jgi:DNA-binding CsgD family transcriptional regulator